MKSFELFNKLLNESILMEMAYQRKFICNRVSNLKNQIIIHLCKVLLFPTSSYREHWMDELNAWLLQINQMTLKGAAGRKLNPENYYEILFKETLGKGLVDLDKKIDILDDHGYIIPIIDNITKTQIYEKLEQIIHDICYDIANNKFNNIVDYLN